MSDEPREPQLSAEVDDRSISLLKANLIATAGLIPVLLIGVGLFTLLWGPGSYTFDMSWIALGVFIVGVVAHELLHGVGWQLAMDDADVDVSYGFKWQALTPYAHLTGPVHLRVYRVGTWLPGVVLGLVPLVLGLALGSSDLLTFGMTFTWSAAGDFMVLWTLRDLPPDVRVEDHPDRAGARVLKP
jgi:hypothetical protein